MLKVEHKILQHFKNNIFIYFIITVSVLALAIRIFGRHFISGDMLYYLLPWYEEALANGGIKSIGTPIGDYNIPYQFFVAIITYIPLHPITLYKLFSIFFDYVLAFSVSMLIYKIISKNETKTSNQKSKYIFCLSYFIILFLPTIWLNSGYWGQADSIYSSFIILSLLLLIQQRYNLSFIMLGIAFAFKLQTIFILPIYFFHYFIHCKYSITRLITITLTSFYTMCIPGFIFGRSLLEPFTIYHNQANHKYIYINYPSFWASISPSTNEVLYHLFKTTSIILSFSILLVLLFYLIYNRISLLNSINLIYVSTFIVYTLILFLVNIHDRYSYILDILFIVLIFLDKKMFKYWIIPIIISLLGYGNYLFEISSISHQILSIFNIANYIFFGIYMFNILSNNISKPTNNINF